MNARAFPRTMSCAPLLAAFAVLAATAGAHAQQDETTGAGAVR